MRAGLSEWLDAYGSAWESRDPEAAAELFTEDAIYQWGPFGRRLRGRPVIREAWAEATETQENVAFRHEILSATARSGLVHWWCELDEPAARRHVQLEGILRLSFDDEGLCSRLEEWYNLAEEPLGGAEPGAS